MGIKVEVTFKRGVYCLNLSAVSDALQQDVGWETTFTLKEIFARIELPPFDQIPDAQAIEAEEESEKVAELNRGRLWSTARNG